VNSRSSMAIYALRVGLIIQDEELVMRRGQGAGQRRVHAVPCSLLPVVGTSMTSFGRMLVPSFIAGSSRSSLASCVQHQHLKACPAFKRPSQRNCGLPRNENHRLQVSAVAISGNSLQSGTRPSAYACIWDLYSPELSTVSPPSACPVAACSDHRDKRLVCVGTGASGG
jgi:hypothetical protein